MKKELAENIISQIKKDNVQQATITLKSGKEIEFNPTDPTGDHGMPCRMASTLKPAEALEALKGFRLKEHKLHKCF